MVTIDSRASTGYFINLCLRKKQWVKKKLAFLYIFTFQWSTKVAYHLIKKGEQEEEEEEEEVKENKVRTALMIK